MTTTHTVSGLDLTRIRTVLEALRAELRDRSRRLATEGAAQWTGSDLVLIVDEARPIMSDVDLSDLLADILRTGRKTGLTGTVRGPASTVVAASPVVRAQLTVGMPLRFEPTDGSPR